MAPYAGPNPFELQYCLFNLGLALVTLAFFTKLFDFARQRVTRESEMALTTVRRII